MKTLPSRGFSHQGTSTLTAVLLASLVVDHAFAAVRYVDSSSASPRPPYSDWAAAAKTIQDAVDVAAAGDEIVVTNGTYATGGRAVVDTETNRVAAGDLQSLALQADGTVVAWGIDRQWETDWATNIPAGLTNDVAVAAGPSHNLALRADGTVAAWGDEWAGQATNVPAGVTHVVAVATGHGYSLALIGDGPPLLTASLSWPTRDGDGFSVSVPTQSGRVYALEYKNSLADAAWTPLPLVAGTGRERTLTDLTATGAQRFYRVRRWWCKIIVRFLELRFVASCLRQAFWRCRNRIACSTSSWRDTFMVLIRR